MQWNRCAESLYLFYEVARRLFFAFFWHFSWNSKLSYFLKVVGLTESKKIASLSYVSGTIPLADLVHVFIFRLFYFSGFVFCWCALEFLSNFSQWFQIFLFLLRFSFFTLAGGSTFEIKSGVAYFFVKLDLEFYNFFFYIYFDSFNLIDFFLFSFRISS